MVGGVFHEQFILVAGQDDSDGRIVTVCIFFSGKIAKVEVHLADVLMLHILQFQINEHETTQDAVVEHQVHPIVGVVDRNAVLAADKSEALA